MTARHYAGPFKAVRRHPPILPLPLAMQRLQAALDVRTTPTSSVSLPALLASIWCVLGDSAWTVRDLQERGLIANTDTRALGQTLAAVATTGERVGEYIVVRLNESRNGRLWMLRR